MPSVLTNNTPEKWEEIKTHPFYADALAELRAFGDAYLKEDIPTLRYSEFC